MDTDSNTECLTSPHAHSLFTKRGSTEGRKPTPRGIQTKPQGTWWNWCALQRCGESHPVSRTALASLSRSSQSTQASATTNSSPVPTAEQGALHPVHTDLNQTILVRWSSWAPLLHSDLRAQVPCPLVTQDGEEKDMRQDRYRPPQLKSDIAPGSYLTGPYQ